MRYYLVENDPDLRYEDIEDLIDYCVCPDDYNNSDEFDEYIDESYSNVDILGYTWTPSSALKTLDETIYAGEMANWVNDRVETVKIVARREAVGFPAGDFFWIGNYEVYIYEDDEAEEEEIQLGIDLDKLVMDKAIAQAEVTIEEQRASEEEDKKREMSFESFFQCL